MELIVNVSENWGIGYQNQLLVSISADLRRFRALTTGKTVILGRKTLETFPGGKPLKNRKNIVLTTSRNFEAEGAVIVHSMEALAVEARKYPTEELCLIGGASLYEQLLDYCETARVTKSYVNCEADRFFPNLDQMKNWKVTDISEVMEEDGVKFQYVDYVNLEPKPL